MSTRLTHFDADGDNSAQAGATRENDTGVLVLVGLIVINPNAEDAFIQLFDAATADVTVGTTTPKQSYKVPAEDYFGGLDFDIAFGTAITYACTTTATGNTDPTTGLTVNLIYEER